MKTSFKIIISILLFVFPWTIRRRLLNSIFKYQIHPNAKIGFSVVVPHHLVMKDGAHIKHLTLCKGLEVLKLGKYSIIGNQNWITGLPLENRSSFQHRAQRNPSLELGNHSAITKRHIIDCTDHITIGAFTTVAGFNSQFLTHSIDIHANIQDCKPIVIGDYCFIGTRSVLLPGAVLPSYCVLGAASLLNKALTTEYTLYGGVPANPRKNLSPEFSYFKRQQGRVN